MPTQSESAASARADRASPTSHRYHRPRLRARPTGCRKTTPGSNPPDRACPQWKRRASCSGVSRAGAADARDHASTKEVSRSRLSAGWSLRDGRPPVGAAGAPPTVL